MSVFTFVTTCVDSDARSVELMLKKAKDISWTTLWRYVDRTEVHEMLGYDVLDRRGGLTLESDVNVPKPAKSMYRGKPCVFVTWSAIEHIFVRNPTAHTKI